MPRRRAHDRHRHASIDLPGSLSNMAARCRALQSAKCCRTDILSAARRYRTAARSTFTSGSAALPRHPEPRRPIRPARAHRGERCARLRERSLPRAHGRGLAPVGCRMRPTGRPSRRDSAGRSCRHVPVRSRHSPGSSDTGTNRNPVAPATSDWIDNATVATARAAHELAARWRIAVVPGPRIAAILPVTVRSTAQTMLAISSRKNRTSSRRPNCTAGAGGGRQNQAEAAPPSRRGVNR